MAFVQSLPKFHKPQNLNPDCHLCRPINSFSSSKVGPGLPKVQNLIPCCSSFLSTSSFVIHAYNLNRKGQPYSKILPHCTSSSNATHAEDHHPYPTTLSQSPNENHSSLNTAISNIYTSSNNLDNTQRTNISNASDRPEFGLPKTATSSRPTSTAILDDDKSLDTILQELSAIQQDGPRKVAILGTRHMSFLHQQIVELLTYANVLVGNHVFTSGASGTNAAVIRGALRAERPDLLTVVLPQSLSKQAPDAREQLEKVQHLICMSENDDLPLDIASKLCNSDILSRVTHFTAFAFHDSDVVLESIREAKSLNKIVTPLFLD